MLHLGDITKISGYTAPIVDVVVGGSPCQDLSVAGKRAGLDGERSGLFIEQLRIIKEMRERDRQNGRTDEHIRPRYMVWENVPGAFSSNKAEDFRIVLEETAKVADKDAVIPMPDKGKWTTSGCILGDGWSIAWRVCDAQFYGVPQRRRRIALIADFGGQSAPEILFVRKSVSRDFEQSKSQRKETPSDASRSIGADDRGVKCLTPWDTQTRRVYDGEYAYPSLCSGENSGQNQQSILIKDDVYCFEPGAAKRLGGYVWEDLAPTFRTEVGDNRPSVAYTLQDREGKARGGKGALIAEELSATLRAGFAQTLFQPVYSVENHPADSRVDIDESGKVQTLTSRMGTGGGNVPMVMESQVYEWHNQDSRITGPIDVGCTISTNAGGREGHLVITQVPNPSQCYSKSKRAQTDTDYETWKESDVANTLNAFDVGDKRTTEAVVQCLETFHCTVEEGISQPLKARDYKDPLTICQAVDCRNGTEDSVNGALQSNMAHSLNGNNVVRTRYIVRRLTPLECERLQGYPDGWTDIGEWTDSKGKVHKTSDAARYKALGNSIALPPWKWVLKRLCACYERDATLASLFDGIGGFPLIWEQLNGKGSCLWVSEIDEFPIAVTKKRIGG